MCVEEIRTGPDKNWVVWWHTQVSRLAGSAIVMVGLVIGIMSVANGGALLLLLGAKDAPAFTVLLRIALSLHPALPFAQLWLDIAHFSSRQSFDASPCDVHVAWLAAQPNKARNDAAYH